MNIKNPNSSRTATPSKARQRRQARTPCAPSPETLHALRSTLESELAVLGGPATIEQHSANPVPSPEAVALVQVAPQLPLSRASKPHGRNGKIARLPKLERDMVNRMLFNNIRHAKIVA